MKKDIFITDLNDHVFLIERPYCCYGQDFVELYAHNNESKKTEYIGTSNEDMSYYYNKNYIILSKDLEAVFAFDINNFCFIKNEEAKENAFREVLKNSLIDVLDNEREAIRHDVRRKVIKVLTHRHNDEQKKDF